MYKYNPLSPVLKHTDNTGVRRFIILILFSFLLTGCETPAGLSSTELKRIGPPGKGHLVRRTKKSSDNFDQKFQKDILRRGLGPAVNDVVTPSYGQVPCNNLKINTKITTIESSKEIDDLIAKAYGTDRSCTTVYTGNGGLTESAGFKYAKTLAYSMIQDMCNPETNNVGNLLSEPSQGYKDAMSLSLFNKGMKSSKSLDNLSTSYALMYVLGQRESGGDFKRGRDISSTNTSAITKEAGPFQVSANSLNLYGKGKYKYHSRDLFRSYISQLSGKSKSERSELCLNDKLAGAKETKPYASSPDELHALFESGDKGRCRGVKAKTSKSTFKLTSSVAACFRDLNKLCPGFSVKYAAGVARINRKHNGPLYTKAENLKRFKGSKKHFKPNPKPACHGIFRSLAANKAKICK
ncbi:MAG: hypothetical protein CME70_24075 [Halobacteriovorax sp.]|nr:hypothetical protein [Halobacteriovorax sp.]